MPNNGAYLISDLPPDHMVEIVCEKCGRKGQYRPSTLLEKFGPEAPLPHVLKMMAACSSADDYSQTCQARYAKQPWL